MYASATEDAGRVRSLRHGKLFAKRVKVPSNLSREQWAIHRWDTNAESNEKCGIRQSDRKPPRKIGSEFTFLNLAQVSVTSIVIACQAEGKGRRAASRLIVVSIILYRKLAA